jgi:hypothetical protein
VIYIGVDPGSTRSGLAAVRNSKVLAVCVAVGCDEADECACLPDVVARFRKDLLFGVGEFFGFAVEGQEYRHAQSKGSPQPLFKVAHAAGAAFAALARMPMCSHGEFVLPSKWKGTVPKLQHHRRLCHKLGWEWIEKATKDPYVVVRVTNGDVVGAGEIKDREWSEVLDAVGIALWLEEKHRGR